MGLTPCDRDYDLARDLLDKEYKSQPLQAVDLYGRLKKLKQVQNNYQLVDFRLDAVATIRKLKELGENHNTLHILQELTTKINYRILEKITDEFKTTQRL